MKFNKYYTFKVVLPAITLAGILILLYTNVGPIPDKYQPVRDLLIKIGQDPSLFKNGRRVDVVFEDLGTRALGEYRVDSHTIALNTNQAYNFSEVELVSLVVHEAYGHAWCFANSYCPQFYLFNVPDVSNIVGYNKSLSSDEVLANREEMAVAFNMLEQAILHGDLVGATQAYGEYSKSYDFWKRTESGVMNYLIDVQEALSGQERVELIQNGVSRRFIISQQEFGLGLVRRGDNTYATAYSADDFINENIPADRARYLNLLEKQIKLKTSLEFYRSIGDPQFIDGAVITGSFLDVAQAEKNFRSFFNSYVEENGEPSVGAGTSVPADDGSFVDLGLEF